MRNLPLDYIAGLIDGEGCFSWTFQNHKDWVPIFSIKMHIRDKELLQNIAFSLRLDNTIHEYTHQNRHYAQLIVRDRESLLFKIVPAVYRRLHGYKKIQLEHWLKEFFDRLDINAELIELCLQIPDKTTI